VQQDDRGYAHPTIVPERTLWWHDKGVRPLRNHTERPALITEAPVSVDEEFAFRRKRYLIMMIVRALCVIGAASTFRFSGWLATAFVVGGLVLPWTAVVMANDRLPKRGVRFSRFHGASDDASRQLGRPGPQALPHGDDQRPGGDDQRPRGDDHVPSGDEHQKHTVIDL
jgi:hypothetical protein